MALEGFESIEESPQSEILAIESGLSSIKKKLQSVPMLNYDFCSALTVPDYESDKQLKLLDEQKFLRIGS